MAARTAEEIEKQVEEIRKRRQNKNGNINPEESILDNATFDSDIYAPLSRKNGYDTSIPVNDEEEEGDGVMFGLNQMVHVANDQGVSGDGEDHLGQDFDPMAHLQRKTIAQRESDYQARRLNRKISPDRLDPFADNGRTPVRDLRSARTYSEIMKETQLKNEETLVIRAIRDKARSSDLKVQETTNKRKTELDNVEEAPPIKKSRFSSKEEMGFKAETIILDKAQSQTDVTPISRIWEETPASQTPSHGASISAEMKKAPWAELEPQTPVDFDSYKTPKLQTELETPTYTGSSISTPTPSRRRSSRWDETPSTSGARTPVASGASTPLKCKEMPTPGATPVGKEAMGMSTPLPDRPLTTPEQVQSWMWEQELDERNCPWTDELIEAFFPFDGYKVLQPPVGYMPVRTPSRKLTATPTPSTGGAGYTMPKSEEGRTHKVFNNQPPGDFPALKPDDVQYFEKLLVEIDESTLPSEERRERTIMGFLLKIKNGTPPMRKSALRQITERAREFGAAPLFNQILPLLMSPTLEDQERHLLVKVIDRIMYKLDDLVRPFAHKILVVIEPLLIDEDYYARVEGREIISNLAKAAGLATMISTMRPDIDNIDEYVRNTTARAFAVVASALGIQSLLPFLRAVCKSKKSWQARHTGIKIVQQIAMLMGCAVLPHLKNLVEIIEHGLTDEQQKVRTITSLAIAGLAEASTPYGIESFDTVLKPLWKGIRQHRGKGLAAFLKAIGYLIPLMDAEYAFHYTKEVVIILIREFPSPDEEMKKIVLKVVKQCCSTDGVEPNYIRTDILPEFFKHFWNHRMALDSRNYRQLVDTTVEISQKVGSSAIIHRVVDDLKDESECYRKMVLETIDKIMENMGPTDIDQKLEEQLIDGILYSFQEQTEEDEVMLNGFGTVVNTLGLRTKPYLPQICGTILWRLNNKCAQVRQQAADLISRVAPVMKLCGEDKLLSHLGIVLYEYLGEEYPEVLGSILSGLNAIVNVVGMDKMNPPIKDLLPRLTPVLKNRHEKVQENCIDLVGRIADRGAEHVSAREWMRICFELLELLKAHKKAIRRATVNTFGYIAKAIGPQDVLATLLSNLKVQERQNRVCTTVAIAIVAETCSPFTVLPALLNEYRVPELNVQNGVLKSLAFLFEYIGEMGKDYVYAVVPLLEDALMDRDLVHRQIACAAVKHVALGVFGFGCEDALTHLMNYVWPNTLELSPHVINAVTEAVEGFRVSIGPGRVLQYCLQGLFHPCRKLRDIYWRIYNMLYVSSQDSLIPFFPTIPNTDRNTYVKYDLFLTI